RYEPLEREAVTGLEIKTVNDNWTGFHGWEFRVGERPVAVGKLGRYCFAGSRERHEVRIVPVKRGPYDEPANPSTVIASVLIDAGQAAADGMVYAALAQPVRLEPNTRYMIASYETAGGDPFAADVELTLDPAIEWVGGCYTLSAPDQPGGYWYPVQSIEPGRALNAVSFVMQ
ncbi:MAG TPA: hypothetical protein PLS90_14455, partial [Candidatus Sumerlaeota bacterium]|nr:hypothetical protein [Candidatus Sumerlaeota bacterium]